MTAEKNMGAGWWLNRINSPFWNIEKRKIPKPKIKDRCGVCEFKFKEDDQPKQKSGILQIIVGERIEYCFFSFLCCDECIKRYFKNG